MVVAEQLAPPTGERRHIGRDVYGTHGLAERSIIAIAAVLKLDDRSATSPDISTGKPPGMEGQDP